MFVPLRIHSVYSRGKGSVTLEEAAGWVGGKGLPAAALADAGNICGWDKWKRIGPAGGFKPLFGCELECGGRRFVFLVRAREGYPNLMEIFNRKAIRDAAGLVVIYIPDARGGQTYLSQQKVGLTPSDGPSEEACLAELREKVAPGDLYIGAEF